MGSIAPRAGPDGVVKWHLLHSWKLTGYRGDRLWILWIRISIGPYGQTIAAHVSRRKPADSTARAGLCRAATRPWGRYCARSSAQTEAGRRRRLSSPPWPPGSELPRPTPDEPSSPRHSSPASHRPAARTPQLLPSTDAEKLSAAGLKSPGSCRTLVGILSRSVGPSIVEIKSDSRCFRPQ